jgi:hypothetical protein
MNLQELQRKLIAAARAEVPGDEVPYAFEKRITALLASRVVAENINLWVRGLWRAAVSCVVLSLLLGVLAWFNPPPPTVSTVGDLSQNFETTLLAAVDQSDQMQ